MSGANIREENLDERIERIRKRDEEIEKKHREAEADRLAALQADAMVKTRQPVADDWPKAHKYDKLDLYDSIHNPAENNNDKNETATKSTKSFKKFPDGQGPPADPTYNFLADAERDGTVDGTEKKERRLNNANNNANISRNRSNNNSFNRGRNKPKGDAPSDNSWRFDRQKSNDGNWRREWDNNKTTLDSGRAIKTAEKVLRGPRNSSENQQGKSNAPAAKKPELAVEKRGNITVSISQDGEVKSVKCKCQCESESS